jgi:hypothetical protein
MPCTALIIGTVASLLNCTPPARGPAGAAVVAAEVRQWIPPLRADFREGVVIDSTIRLSVHPSRSLDQSTSDWNAARLFEAYATVLPGDRRITRVRR